MNFIVLGKCKFQMVMVFLMVFILGQNRLNSYIIKLYDKIHFYELDVQQFPNKWVNFKQPFNYKIDQTAVCLPMPTSHPKMSKFSKELDLNAKVLIYPDHEQTMSFVIQIGFQHITSIDIEGYEMVFEQENSSKNCIRIMLNDIKLLNILTIKDPSFVNFNNTLYSFFFGTVFVRPLLKCPDYKNGLENNICTLDNFYSDIVKIGIASSNASADLRPIKPDLCGGNLMTQTCIIRYIKDDEQYFIIMHPISDQFERIIADIDVFTLDIDQMRDLNKAKKKGQEFVKLAEKEYRTSDVGDDVILFLYHIQSFNRQKLENGLVIKFVKYSSERIIYVGLVDKPTENNSCNKKENQAENKFCLCNNECIRCSQFSNKSFGGVNLDVDWPNTEQLAKKSKHCYDQYFKSFKFDNVDIVKLFRNQPITMNKREIVKNSTYSMANRDTLPRLCFEIEKKRTHLYSLNVILNDYNMIAQSTQIITRYSFIMYSMFNDKKSVADQAIYPDHSIVMKLKLEKNIYLNNSIIIENFKKGFYLIELIPEQKSAYCGQGECVDESFYKNQIQCVKCDKLLTLFYLNDQMLSKKTSCSIDRLVLKKFLSANQTSADTAYTVTQYPGDSDELILKNEIYSMVTEQSFKPNMFLLPYQNLFLVDQNDLFDENNIHHSIELHLSTSNLVIFSIVIIITIMFFFVIIYYNYLSALSSKFLSRPKKVVVYLSIFIEESAQSILSEFTSKFIRPIKEKFGDTEIITIDFKSNKDLEVIEKADVIFYICGNGEEIDYITNRFMFGENEWHHDFNKMHHQHSCQNKTFNVIFGNKLTKQTESANISRSNGHKFLQIPKETDVMVNIFLSKQKSKSLDSKLIRWMINRYFVYSLEKIYQNEIKKNENIFSIKLADF